MGGPCIAQRWALPSRHHCLLRAGSLHQSPSEPRAGCCRVLPGAGLGQLPWPGLPTPPSGMGHGGDGTAARPVACPRAIPAPGGMDMLPALPTECHLCAVQGGQPRPPSLACTGGVPRGSCCRPGREGASPRDKSSPWECFAAVCSGPGARVLTNSGKVWGCLSKPDTDVL